MFYAILLVVLLLLIISVAYFALRNNDK